MIKQRNVRQRLVNGMLTKLVQHRINPQSIDHKRMPASFERRGVALAVIEEAAAAASTAAPRYLLAGGRTAVGLDVVPLAAVAGALELRGDGRWGDN
jgi:hypothetical protein